MDALGCSWCVRHLAVLVQGVARWNKFHLLLDLPVKGCLRCPARPGNFFGEHEENRLWTSLGTGHSGMHSLDGHGGAGASDGPRHGAAFRFRHAVCHRQWSGIQKMWNSSRRTSTIGVRSSSVSSFSSCGRRFDGSCGRQGLSRGSFSGLQNLVWFGDSLCLACPILERISVAHVGVPWIYCPHFSC